MAWFGYGTTRQQVLDLVTQIQEDSNLNDKEAIAILVDVITYFVEKE